MFDPQRHTNVDPDVQWQAATSRAFIESYFSQAEKTFADLGYWPAHEDDGPIPTARYHHGLYEGMAGVCWAQLALAQRGYGLITNDYRDAVMHSRAAQHNELRDGLTFENKQDYFNGLLVADLGFMAPLLRLDPAEDWIEETLSLISRNLENPVLELLWGSPGSLLMLSASITSGVIPRKHCTLLDQGLNFLESQLITSPSTGAELWQQYLYDKQLCLTGAGHGFAGVGLAILQALPFLPERDANIWHQRLRATAIATAHTENTFANWRPSIDQTDNVTANWLVQFCHGAPGMLMCLAGLMGEDEHFDQLMLKAGALTYHAGPLTKGGNFCHGTAGNGYALLKLFQHTQDQMWLDRAQQFAAAAQTQVLQNRAKHNGLHYSLWTGDTGVAFFADACLRGDGQMPTLEWF